jgi:hypothetical protein
MAKIQNFYQKFIWKYLMTPYKLLYYVRIFVLLEIAHCKSFRILRLTEKGQWTWIDGGGPDVLNLLPVYNQMGIANSTNYPGSRYNPVSWLDDNGHLWMYGGSQGATNSTVAYPT